MAEIRLPVNSTPVDWRRAIREKRTGDARVSVRSGEDTEPKRIREFAFGERVTIEGVEYWFEPERGACADSLGLPRWEIGSFGAVNSVINFYDYHASAGTVDTKKRFLDTLHTASTDTTRDGYRVITWRNCYTKSFEEVRTGLYDYLGTYVWPQKCSAIVDLIDSNARASTKISKWELQHRDITIGWEYFNDIFYLTVLEVADALLTEKLKKSMFDSIPVQEVLTGHARPQNALITQFDEAQLHEFCVCLEDGEFGRDWQSRPERHWRCSSADLQTRILPLILFVSNWSLVLASYLTVLHYGSLAITVGE